MNRTLDDLRSVLHQEARRTADPDTDALLAGARQRVMSGRRRRLAALSAVSAAVMVVAGFAATTSYSTRQGLPQPAVPLTVHTPKTPDIGETSHRAQGPGVAKGPRDYLRAGNGLNRLATGALQGFDEGLTADPTFAGVLIERSGVRLNYVGKPSAAFRAKVDALPENLDWHLRKVPNSLASLERVGTRINLDRNAWARKGIHVSGWGPDIRINRVSVMLFPSKVPHQIAASRIVKAYGANMVVVESRPSYAVPVGG